MANKIKINKTQWSNNKPSSYAISQLSYMGIDASVNRVNEKLRNIRGMSEFSYTSIDSKIQEANDLLETLCYYIDGTLEDINDKIDEPFFKRFDNKTGILEKFERINLDDYKTKNTLGIQEHGTTQVYDYPSGTYKTQSYSYTKENIGLKDLLNNLEVKGFQGMPSFTEMMQEQYKNAVENPEMDLTYEEYVEAILHRSDIQHTVDRGWLNFASDVLDLVGVVSIVALFTGEDFITGEILTDAEKSSAVFNTVINVGLLAITLATAGAGSVAATGMKLGLKGTNKVLLQTLAVDMISGVSGMGAVNLLDAAGSPEYLSAIVGLGVSFFGGYKGGKAVQAIGSRANGTKSTDFLSGMNAEDAKRYKLWNNLRENGLDQAKINDISLTNKGLRPNPNTYLSETYINNHLKQFNDGASIIMTKEQYLFYVKGNDYIGILDDKTQFLLPKNMCDELVSSSGNNISAYETALGFDIGHFEDGGGLIRIDIDDVKDLNLRVPSGNEYGANSHWLPGGYTDNGITEAVSDLIPNKPDIVTVTELNK